MKKLIFPIIFFMIFLASVNAYVYESKLVDTQEPFKVIKQDYIEDYIDYSFVKVNDTQFKLIWQVKDPFVFETLKDCFSLKDDDCVNEKADKYNSTVKDYEYRKLGIGVFGAKYTFDEFKDSYFENIDDKKFNDDITALKLNTILPKNVTKGKIQLIGDVNPLVQNKGQIIINLGDGVYESQGAEFKIGFSTFITTFNNSLSTENLPLGLGNGFYTNYTRHLQVPLYSVLNNMTINWSGYSTNNGIYDYIEPFSSASISNKWNYSCNSAGCVNTGTCSSCAITFSPQVGYMQTQGTANTGAFGCSCSIEGYFNLNNTNPYSILINTQNLSINVRIVSSISGGRNSGDTCGDANFNGYCDITVGSTRVYTTGTSVCTGSGGGSSSDEYLKINFNTTDNKIFVYNLSNGLLITNATITPNTFLGFSTRTGKAGNAYVTTNCYVYPIGVNYNSTRFKPFITSNTYPNGTNMYINGDLAYSNSTQLTTVQKINVFTNVSNAFNGGNCGCSGCVKTSSYCYIPFTFTSINGGGITYSGILLDLNFTSSNLTLNIYDSVTKQKVNFTNITVNLIGSIFQLQNITSSGQSYFNFPFNTSVQDNLKIQLKSTYAPYDYSLAVFELNVSQGLSYESNVYITNTSDTTRYYLTTILVRDQDTNPLKNALVTIQKQDPSTNTYLTVGQIRTNDNGEIQVRLDKDSYYLYMVQYNGAIVYTSTNPSLIVLDPYYGIAKTIYLNCNLLESNTELLNSLINTNIGINFIETTDSSGYFRTIYTGTTSIEVCTYIYNVSSLGNTLNQSLCYNSSSFSFDSSLLNVTNITTYIAYIFADTHDGFGKRYITSDSYDLGLNLSTTPAIIIGIESIIILIAAIIIPFLGFREHPIGSVILLIVLMVGVYATHLTLLTKYSLSVIIFLAIFTTIVLSKRRTWF